ncbi:MAG: prepilin-type N-terminal cleavage/methylation domain-containing protein [Rubrivivax sp.]|jgi:MSHA pilin protein MshA|nr:prepilin-type N-terminal cleavage/methylation domain-containing protein [Rubrivivax sp.]
MPTFRFYPRLAGQTGFTLVELITVILILGVLAAVAIPRYSDLQGKARESKVRAIAGSMKAAAGITKAQAVATGVSCASATAGTVTLEGRSIALNHCFPQALTGLTAGILGAANVESDGGWTAAISTGTAGAVGAVLDLSLNDAATPANCKVTYTAAASAGTEATVTTVTSGC